MIRVTSLIPILLVGSPALYAQSAAKLEFEVASIKPSHVDLRGYTMGCRGGPASEDPALWSCENVNLSGYLIWAYHVDYYQIAAPDWTNDARFDIRAVVPEGTSIDQFHVMLQNLLADRFKLTVHREVRQIPQYDLVLTKGGPKFKEAAAPPVHADAGGEMDRDGYPILRDGATMGWGPNGRVRIHDPRITMQMLAERLTGQLDDKPVTDATGLKGEYEISLYWGGNAMSWDDSAPTLMQALADQLGLRLEAKKRGFDFIVVDSALKVPTEN